MKLTLLLTLCLCFTSCATTPSLSDSLSGRNPAGDSGAIARASYAQYLAHIWPKIEGKISAPEITTRIGAPAPKDPIDFMAKLTTLLSLKPVSEDLLITDKDFDLSHPEAVALFHLYVSSTEQILITAPLVDGKAPSPSLRQIFDGDAESNGHHLMGLSVDDVARAVLELPKMTRGLIKQIDLHSKRNPLDAIFKVAYKRTDFRSYMAANTFPAGVVGIFPQVHATGLDDQPEPLEMANTLAHELGHTWTYECFGMNPGLPGSIWQEWQAAAASDKMWVSDYATSSILEDTAESALIYAAVSSWPKEDLQAKALESKISQMIPAKWKILKDYYPNCEKNFFTQ